MPTGKFKRSLEHRQNISKALTGKPKPWLRKPLTSCQTGQCHCLCKCGCGFVPPLAIRSRIHLGHIGGNHIDYLRSHALKGRTRTFTPEWKNKISASRIKSGVAKGSNNPNWQGGKTKANIAIRNSGQYKIWRKAVYERDGYKCVECGVPGNGKNLQADHIKPFSTHIELRFDIDNGRTLCIDCHKKTDSYGWNATNNYIRKLTK